MFAVPRRETPGALRRFRAVTRCLGFLALGALSAVAAWAEPVKIGFVPPPMEGSISLGIYDATGKLVRVLHREAETAAFARADDALQTEWDGKDDQGADLPAGTYRAKGVMVGDLGVEGEGYIGNDWVSDDSPHLGRITDLKANGGTGKFFVDALLPGLKTSLAYSVVIKPSETPGEDAETVLTPEAMIPLIIGEGVPPSVKSKPVDYGFNHTVWGIDGDTVKQYGIDSTVIHTLTSKPGDPPPVKLAASTISDKLYVLYENDKLQRLRGYDFTSVKPGEAPKVLFENDIVFSETYEQIAQQLKFPDGKPFSPSPELKVALVRNPLLKKRQAASLQLCAIVDKEGAWIAASDGLPLCQVSDTPHLRWAAMNWPGPKKPITFFDSDGAVVEQFQIGGIANMMTFDAGAHQWTPPAPSPSPSATPAFSATAQP